MYETNNNHERHIQPLSTTTTSTATIHTLSLHDALPISSSSIALSRANVPDASPGARLNVGVPRLSFTSDCLVSRLGTERSEEHTSELQSRGHLVCRLLLEKKK